MLCFHYFNILNNGCSEKLFTMFIDSSEAFVKFIIWAFSIMTVKATDAGNAILVKHNRLMMAALLASFLNLLVFVLATVLQLDIETRSLIVEIALGSSVSILASFVISSAIGWLTLSLYICVFAIVAFVIMRNTTN